MKQGANSLTPKQRKPKVTDELDIDRVCELLTIGCTLTGIAEQHKCSLASLIAWIAETPERSARTRTARQEAAKLWDEEATRRIEEAKDSFDLSKAKELAHHYRWRASKIAPKEYGDKVDIELTGKDGGPVEYTNTERASRLAAILERGRQERDRQPPKG